MGLWMRWLNNMTCVFLGKTMGNANSHREQVGWHVGYESHRRPVVALHSPSCIWLGRGSRRERPDLLALLVDIVMNTRY